MTLQQPPYAKTLPPEPMHFITLTTNIQGAWFVAERECRKILDAFESDRQRLGLDCLGYVLMPDCLHALLYQHGSGPVVRQFVQNFKQATSQKLHGSDYPGRTLWRIRFADEPIASNEQAREKIKFMHNCPVHAGLTSHTGEYRWSSAHRAGQLVSVAALQ